MGNEYQQRREKQTRSSKRSGVAQVSITMVGMKRKNVPIVPGNSHYEKLYPQMAQIQSLMALTSTKDCRSFLCGTRPEHKTCD
jgi:hypothetical protein